MPHVVSVVRRELCCKPGSPDLRLISLASGTLLPGHCRERPAHEYDIGGGPDIETTLAPGVVRIG